MGKGRYKLEHVIKLTNPFLEHEPIPETEQLNEFCKNPPCASDTCRKLKTCVYE